MKKAIFLLLIAFVLATANAFGDTASQLASAGVGNGEVYAGGDLLERKLLAAREKLNQSFSLIQSGFDIENLCSIKTCRKGNETLCSALTSLTPMQQGECRNFIVGKISEMEAINTPKLTPFVVSQIPLMVKQNGSLRPVSAMTKAGKGGQVSFHYGSIANVSYESLMALIAHELGHKIKWGKPEAFILDDVATPGFTNGRQFLDAIAASLSLYSVEHNAPSQAAPALPASVSLTDVCPIATDSHKKFLAGLSVDTKGKLTELPTTKGSLMILAQASLASPEARKLVIKRFFRKHLLRDANEEELELMVQRVSSGIPHEAIIASILGDEEYAMTRGSIGNNQFITSAHLDLYGRNPTFQEAKTLLTQLQKLDRSSVVLSLAKRENEAWKKWVSDWYEEWLNRSPNAQELEAHVRDLRSGAGWESVKASILSSPEYFTLQTARFQACKNHLREVAQASR